MSESLSPEDRQRIERALDRIEERVFAAPPGLHRPGERGRDLPAALGEAASMVWTRYDGFEVGGGDALLLPAAQVTAATAQAQADGLLRDGDVVVGEQGRDFFVLPGDPWEEGADVVRIVEDGTRLPEACSVAHLLLGMLVEASVIYDPEGEFRDEIFGEDGELEPTVERKLLRRRLDVDPDAPRTRLRLAQSLRAGGELRGAERELSQVLRRAPELCWAHQERGRVLAAMGQAEVAAKAHDAAAEHAPDPELAAYFSAWAARACEPDARGPRVARVLAVRPHFAAEQLRAAQALLDDEDEAAAREVVALGLAVVPGHLELLALAQSLAARPQG